jgi:hypothetical protein
MSETIPHLPDAAEHPATPEPSTNELPDDPVLQGLGAIRRLGLAAVLPALAIGDSDPVDLRVLAYKPRKRIALRAMVRNRCFIVKINAKDTSAEVGLHQAFGAHGITDHGEDRVPALLAHDLDLRVMALGWLEGSTTAHLLRHGLGRRAGELAARWLRRAVTLPLKLGKTLLPETVLRRVRKCVDALGDADAGLGEAGAVAAGILENVLPPPRPPRLVHGTFHDRNVLDLGDGVGVIDWQRFRQGPTEFDAGTFLASITRVGLREERARDAALAEKAFLTGIAGLVDERSLAWHRGAALLTLADRLLTQKRNDWLVRTHALVCESASFAAMAGWAGAQEER